MVKLFAKFFQAIHGTKIVPCTIQCADNGILFSKIFLTDRVLYCFYPVVMMP